MRRRFFKLKSVIEDPSTNNIIYYTTTNGNKLPSSTNATFENSLISNTYENGIGKLVYQNPITVLTSYMFYACYTLKSITLPANISRVNSYALYGCWGLEDTNINLEYVNYIGDYAFADCRSFETLDLSELVSIETINTGAFGNLHRVSNSVNTVVIPDNIKNIYQNGCTGIGKSGGINTIILGKGIKTIEDRAFYDCKHITTVVCRNPQPPSIGTNAFTVAENCVLKVPVGAIESYANNDRWKASFTTIEEEV